MTDRMIVLFWIKIAATSSRQLIISYDAIVCFCVPEMTLQCWFWGNNQYLPFDSTKGRRVNFSICCSRPGRSLPENTGFAALDMSLRWQIFLRLGLHDVICFPHEIETEEQLTDGVALLRACWSAVTSQMESQFLEISQHEKIKMPQHNSHNLQYI